MPHTAGQTGTQLSYDKMECYLRALQSIVVTSYKYAKILFQLVEACIPEDVLRVWLRNTSRDTAG